MTTIAYPISSGYGYRKTSLENLYYEAILVSGLAEWSGSGAFFCLVLPVWESERYESGDGWRNLMWGWSD